MSTSSLISAVTTTAESAPAHIFERRRSFQAGRRSALDGRGQRKGHVLEFVDQLEVTDLISTTVAVTVTLELLDAEIGLVLSLSR